MPITVNFDGKESVFIPPITIETVRELKDHVLNEYPEAPIIQWHFGVNCEEFSPSVGFESIKPDFGVSHRRVFSTKYEGSNDDQPNMKLWTLSHSPGAPPDDAPATPFLLKSISASVHVYSSRKITIHLNKAGETLSVAYYEGIDLVKVVAKALKMNSQKPVLYAKRPHFSCWKMSNAVQKFLKEPLKEMVPPGHDIYVSTSLEIPEVYVLINGLTGQIKPYYVTHSTPVWELKRLIQDEDSIPHDQQCLIYAGQRLHDEKTLGEYCQPQQTDLSLSTFHLTGRLRGGMFHATSGRFNLDNVAAIKAKGKIPLEVVLPDRSSILMDVDSHEDPENFNTRLQGQLTALLVVKHGAKRLATELDAFNSSDEKDADAMKETLQKVQEHMNKRVKRSQ